MIHADQCIDAPLDHSGPCKRGFSVAGQFTQSDQEGLDDSLATPLTDSNRRHRVEDTPLPEAVDHPAHYGGADNPYETIKVMEAWMTSEQLDGFLLGNSIKYLSRAGKKGPVEKTSEDLSKARWYLDRYIQRVELRTSS